MFNKVGVLVETRQILGFCLKDLIIPSMVVTLCNIYECVCL